ncbi:MAG: LysR substrate-binding domain-containing protein [Acetobacter sp.]|uniref:LysR substrate-binding domain-containing protein n=1 Tax=Acetobacter sp. TaxID=440 RepID=UPI0039E7A201
MAFARRFLPPISLLCSFEAAARHQNFTTAAKELHLTQSAISRHIRLLEEQLGALLFVRERQTVRLTIAGESYAREVRAALKQIAAATLGLRAAPAGGTLNLSIVPTFGSLWLAPKLPDFKSRYPDITVNLFTRATPFDFASEPMDAAIHFGIPDWPGTESTAICGETIAPVCAPALAARHRFQTPADLLDAPLLHLVSRPDAWERWFNAQGLDADRIHGMLCDQFYTMTQIAVAGGGLGLLPEILIQPELHAGTLVRIGPSYEEQSEAAYYLVWPQDKTQYKPLELFRLWLAEQIPPPPLNRPDPA